MIEFQQFLFSWMQICIDIVLHFTGGIISFYQNMFFNFRKILRLFFQLFNTKIRHFQMWNRGYWSTERASCSSLWLKICWLDTRYQSRIQSHFEAVILVWDPKLRHPSSQKLISGVSFRHCSLLQSHESDVLSYSECKIIK